MRTLGITLLFGFVMMTPVSALSLDGLGAHPMEPLGFRLSADKGELMKDIEESGAKVLKNTKDSKKIRTLVLDGVYVELPFDPLELSIRTELELWDKSLMGSMLILKGAPSREWTELVSTVDASLVELYGEPSSRDSFLGMRTSTWHIDDVVLVFAFKSKKGRITLKYTYKPLLRTRMDMKYEEEQKPPKEDPAKKMFLSDGPPRPR